MGAHVRRLIRFPCGDVMLSGSLDEAAGKTGLLCVTGGSQVRAGPHRLLHRLGVDIAATGTPTFRYERRGVGDSDGSDPGYRDSRDDLAAAVIAFRAECPHVTDIIGFGLCDGATTLALHGQAAGVQAIILANPWLVEVEPGTLAPAATRVHYRDKMLSPRAWASVLTGKVDVVGAVKSLFGAVAKPEDTSLAGQVAERLIAYAGKLTLVLSRGDGTAIAARSCWDSQAFRHVRGERVVTIESDSHTFARPGDYEQLLAVAVDFIRSHKPAG